MYFFDDVTELHLIADVIGHNTFFSCFGDVIGVQQVWWLSINLQSNKKIVFGKISQLILWMLHWLKCFATEILDAKYE